MRREAAGDVVRVQDRDLRRAAQAVGPIRDVGPGDREDAPVPHGVLAIGPMPVARPAAKRMGREERGEVRAHADRPDAGPPPPCGMR